MTTTTTTTMPLSEDLQEMSALGSFMFLLNDLRKMYRCEIESEDPSKFEPIMNFPLKPSTIQEVVMENLDACVAFQGENRHQSHMEMFEFINKTYPDDAEGEPTLLLLDYHEEDPEKAHLSYTMALDHIKKRIVVVFRGSVTAADWKANGDFQQFTMDNPVYNKDGENDDDVPEQITLHHGFYDYVVKDIDYEDENGKKYTKLQEVVWFTKQQLEKYPDYEVYTTGVSLGGALTQVFAFFAAASYPELGTIKCYSFASPKVGTLSFRLALQELEKKKRLQLLRLTGHLDPVILLPRDPLKIIPCDVVLSTFFSATNQGKLYRHVGMRCLLFKKQNQKPIFSHTKIQNRYCRVFCSDIGKLWGRLAILIAHCVCFWNSLENYRANHGYPEYWYRVNTHLSTFEDLTLDQLYDEFLSGDRTHVGTRFM